MSVEKSKRIFYFDALRTFAIICVIIIHVYQLLFKLVLPQYGVIPSFQWLYTQIAGNCFRIGVDLFLMLSGALSLGRVWSIKDFLSRRIPRIVLPFLFWGFILSIIFILLSYFGNYTFIKSFYLHDIVRFIYRAYTFKNNIFMPFWFFWMILGTYFIMPIFNKWLLHSKLGEVEYFLVLWLITCLFDFTLFIELPLNLSYFTSPIGLVILGYYLRHTKRKIFNNHYCSLMFIAIPAILMTVISYILSDSSHIHLWNRYSFLTVLEATGVFLLFKNFNKFNISVNDKIKGLFHKIVVIIARYSYGIYLIHILFLAIFLKTFHYKTFNYDLLVIFLVIYDLVISVVVMDLLNRVPYINKIIGAK